MADRVRKNRSSHLSRVWLAAGALALGAGAVLAVGAGTAHADADAGASASDGARSAGAAARSSARESGQRVRGSSAASGAASAGGSPADRRGAPALSSVTASRHTAGTAAAPAPAPCLQAQTCGTATFTYVPAPQTWTVPAGVQSVYVQAQGAYGGVGGNSPAGQPALLQTNLPLTGGSPTTALSIYVASAGQASNGSTGGTGGNGTGGSGGSGSLSGNAGGGGGGATTVAAVAGDATVTVLVAGGGGGSGGDRNGSGGAGGNAGGAQANPVPPSADGVWQGSAGSPGGSDDNPGAGGAGGTQSQGGFGTAGGDAETLSGNGGGGGGGGGWGGGAGGEPGQAGVFGTPGAGGGGGGGSSYANPDYITFAAAGPPVVVDPNTPFDGLVVLNWVDILTAALRPLRSGRATDQQLAAATSGLPTGYSLQWSVSTGLPEGLTLSPTGALSGTPKKAGAYSFLTTVRAVDFNAEYLDITSVITYSGTVCSRRCGRGGRT